ncbi:MAG: hypothetical protein JNM66_13325 [Bryobacterales bacterium]|nr:hypothetical protein [Bryobacterales bacterium]
MTCQWQTGMLVMRECGAPATAGCALCGRALCMIHTSMGQNGPACPGCAATHDGYARNEETELAASREEYYRPYGGVAGYGQQGYFSGADAAAMNRGPVAQRRPAQEDDYDAMET